MMVISPLPFPFPTSSRLTTTTHLPQFCVFFFFKKIAQCLYVYGYRFYFSSVFNNIMQQIGIGGTECLTLTGMHWGNQEY